MLLGLFVIFLAVLLLPFRVKRVEENLEAFLFACGVAVLSYKKNISFAVHRDKNHRAAMLDDLKRGLTIIWRFEGITTNFICASC